MKKIIISFMVIFFAVISICYSESKKIQKMTVPDEYTVKEKQLTFTEAMVAITSIYDSLVSFRRLTDLIESKTDFRNDNARLSQQKEPTTGVKYPIKITLDELNNIGNLGWSFQNLGFGNRMTLIEGTLLSQQARIKELEYEILKLKKSSQMETEKTQKELDTSKKELNHFLETHSWAD